MENYMKLNEEILNGVNGGAGSAGYDFSVIVREMVIADRAAHSEFEKTVDGYRIVVNTHFTYNNGYFDGSYSYKVYEGDIPVDSGYEGDFTM